MINFLLNNIPTGWTNFVASSDTRIVYVASNGNDANDGLSPTSPKRTVNAGWGLLRNGYPDWLLLRSGDVFNERIDLFNKSGRSATEPMRIGSYGTGPRPRMIAVNAEVGKVIAMLNTSCFAITDLELSLDEAGAGNAIAVYENCHNILIENCHCHDMFVGIVIQGNATNWNSSIRLHRNVVVDCFRGPTALGNNSIGIFFGYTDGVILTENVLDHNGWREGILGAEPTVYRHNVYINNTINNNVVTKDNILARGAASGLRSGGHYCIGNLCLRNPVGIVGDCFTKLISQNVVLDSMNIGTVNAVGIGITCVTSGCEISNNVLAYRTTFDGQYNNLSAIHIGDNSVSGIIKNNTVYNWHLVGGQSFGRAFGMFTTPQDVTLVGNVFQQANGGDLIICDNTPSLPHCSGNTYFSTKTTPFYGNPTLAQYNYAVGFANWQTAARDNSAWTQVQFVDCSRTIETYAASIGLEPTLEAFLTAARHQDKNNYRPELTAYAVNGYIRGGLTPRTSGWSPDMDHDGKITVNDYILFMNAFARHDPTADVNNDGMFNVNDYVLFQTAAAVAASASGHV